MAKPQTRPQTPDPRAVARQILGSVLGRGHALDEALAGHGGLARLEPRDRGFARTLIATTLRRLGQIDSALESCLERPLKPAQAELENLLRLGACQLLFLETPAHAAVSTSVEQVRGKTLAPYRALVNAVLRRVAREREALLAGQDAARLDTPDWLWSAWATAYGEPTARAIAEAQLSDPPLDLSVKVDPETWAERLGAELLPTGTLRLPPGSGEVTRLAGYDDGAWWVQDAAAALPARLLGPVAGKRVIDLCAAPGGKTAQLAAAGADVVAVDRAEKRLARLTRNLARLGLGGVAVAADATAWRPETPADAVLLDAPCSATGTLRRHPDIARLKEPGQIPALTELQDRLLAAAASMVAPGGLLVYAVCSLQPEEGPARVAAWLEAGASFECVPVTPEEVANQRGFLTDAGELRTLPSHWADLGGLDGFYACRLRRKS